MVRKRRDRISNQSMYLDVSLLRTYVAMHAHYAQYAQYAQYSHIGKYLRR
jgi:hypothetical protein